MFVQFFGIPAGAWNQPAVDSNGCSGLGDMSPLQNVVDSHVI